MSTPTRLLLFSLISAIETDLRDLVRIHLLAQPTFRLPADLMTRALDRFQRDRDDSTETPGDDALVPYFDLSDTFKLLNQCDEFVPEAERRHVRSLTPLLEELVPIRNRVMHARPLLGMDYELVLGTTQRLVSDRPSMWQELAVTLDRANHTPDFVLRARIPEYWSDQPRTHHNLPSLDCDDTGFVGRSNEVTSIQKAIRGPYPVITVLGEGGVGKTATALKAVWDIVDEGAFDAIVWATAKTSVLSGTELKRVQGAISTTLGLLTAVSKELSGRTDNPVEEILEYLKDFKILLLLDNLETVVGVELRDFLEKLPNGSKVLVTSRVGLGALDYPIRLGGMSDSDAVLLMRIVARLRGVEYLVQTDNKTVEEYCRQLHRNPGFIKWFVSGVQAGRRPEELLAKPETFLDFCLSNVFDSLQDEAQKLVGALACVAQPMSQGEFAFLTRLTERQVHAGLLQLISTGMVSMQSAPTGNTFTTVYRISELARRFILTQRSPSELDAREYARKVRQLRFTDEELSQLRNANPYDLHCIHTRSKRDLPIARMLLDALQISRRGQIEAAIAKATEAKELDPGFAETRRILGFIHHAAGNKAAARDEYEAAVDLDPAPRTRLFYGGCLQRDDDLDGALVQLKEAERLDPSSSVIKLEVARCHLYRHEWDATLAKLTEVEPANLEKLLRKYHDLTLQCHARRADDAVKRGDVSEGIDALETAKQYFDKLDDDMRDLLIFRRMEHAATTASLSVGRAANSHGIGSPLHTRAIEVEQKLAAFSARLPTRRGPSPVAFDEPKKVGRVVGLFRSYGFIGADGDEQLFFHRGSLEVPSDWSSLTEGSVVRFSIGSNHEGRCAVSVVLRPTDDLDVPGNL